MSRHYGALRERMFAFFDAEGTSDFTTAELRERFNCADTTAQRYRLEWHGVYSDPVVEPLQVPLSTFAGMIWTKPIKAPRIHRGDDAQSVCDKCTLCDRCRVMVYQGGFAGCERPLQSELTGVR